jgi:hypothetical protein
MKVMNEIKSEISGEILEILVENGEPVEFRSPSSSSSSTDVPIDGQARAHRGPRRAAGDPRLSRARHRDGRRLQHRRRTRSTCARRAAICIGPPPSRVYLDIPRSAAAEVADVEAIHPGYGFLAESDAAEVCRSYQTSSSGRSPRRSRCSATG